VKITALYHPDDITLMFTLFPILKSRYAGLFDFTPDPEAVWRYRNKAIVLFRFVLMEKKAGGAAYVERLRQKYERIIYFDDLADPREIMGDLIGLVDVYYKKQLLADRLHYTREVYGNRLFTDYYHERYGVEDADPVVARPLTHEEIAKLRLSWNLGIGSYPKNRIRKAVCTRLGARGLVWPMRYVFADPRKHRTGKKNIMRASSRFRASMDRKTVVFHRELFLKEAESRPDLFATGHLALEEYNKELADSIAALSPFGWGEICFRDFEAIVNRAVLLKPSMDHIETWPDVYKADKTYVSLDWDAKNVIAKTEEILSDVKRRTEIVENAYAAYDEGLRGAEDRVRNFVAEALK
jgi:hypothetical protein